MIYLKIDYDLPFSLIPDWVREMKIVCAGKVLSRFGLWLDGYRWSQSKNGNTHLTLMINADVDPDPAFLCWLQWILGDDDGRTWFNLKRIAKGIKNWNVLNRV